MSKPEKLYLLQLSTTDVPLPSGHVLEMVTPSYLIEMNDGQRILVDSGFPADVPAPSQAPPPQNKKNVLEHLADLKLSTDDINTVVCTHFDVDHAGYHDSFKKAEFVVQRRHYELAKGGNARYTAARSHWDDPALRYKLIDGDFELVPGVRLIETSGHAPGHQSVLVQLPRSGPVLLAIDAVVMKRLFTTVRKAWPIDDNEEELRASTQRLLDIVQREKVPLTVFGHDGAQWKTLTKAPHCYD